jgi:hypothetical protein
VGGGPDSVQGSNGALPARFDALVIRRAQPGFGCLDQRFLVQTALGTGRCRIALSDAMRIGAFGRGWIADELNRLCDQMGRPAVEELLTSSDGLLLAESVRRRCVTF